MPKHTFNIVCTDDTVGSNPQYKRIKLVGNVNGEEKTIKLCGPYFEAPCIRERNGKESFTIWVEKAKYNFCEDDFCDSWTDKKLYYKENIPLEEVKLKVILDEDCEYKIAVVTPFNGIRTCFNYLSDRRLVIEGNDSNELSVYLSDQAGARTNNLEYFNRLLESALLENSNVREVLPELGIGVVTPRKPKGDKGEPGKDGEYGPKGDKGNKNCQSKFR
ncbi:MAG: collagen-like protein [Wolbachia endosymbiont of Penenirmus auritus]|nr:collagen-like protein [Wolbachia endosymbiont of Penenirmus auritus]